MNCPSCNDSNTKVIDSRYMAGVNQIKRRRECLCCHERFTTFERAELNMPSVIKRGGSRMPFSEQKLRNGLSRALEKRPVSVEAFENMVSDIVKSLLKRGESEVSTQVIGDTVLQALKDIDQVAYVRFASVYKSFEDIEAFQHLLMELADHKQEV